MAQICRFALIGACLSVAAASGYVMEHSDSLGPRPQSSVAAGWAPPRAAPPEPLPADAILEITPVAQIAEEPPHLRTGGTELPLVPLRDVSDHSRLAGLALAPEPVTGPGFGLPATLAPTLRDGLAETAPGCAAAQLSLAAGPNGLVLASLHAPCLPETLVHLRQGPLGFDIRTDDLGAWSGLVPALGGQTVLQARLPAGPLAEAVLPPQDTAGLNRVILSWSGPDVLRLNAFEYGAAPNSAGHISAAAPRTPDTRLGGYMLVLGEIEGGAFAEVYTAPADMTDIGFDLEARLTSASCDQDIQAQLIRVFQTTPPEVTPISLAMPDCSQPEGALLMDLPSLPVELAALR